MKTQRLTTMALCTLLAALSQAKAGEIKLSKSQVPKAVIAAFEKANPDAKALEFEEEMFRDKVAYEVEYKKNGREYEFLYSANGSLLQKEKEIDVKKLPVPVIQAIKKAYPKAEIKEAEQVMKPDSTISGYEVEIKAARKEIELEMDASGVILKTKNE
jgi:uncharacterized membrane protein YkoI